MASIYLRGKVWWIRYYPSPGARQIFKSLKTRDRKVAEHRRDEIQIDVRRGDSPLPQLNRRFEDIKAEFLDRQKSLCTRKHFTSYKSYLKQFCELIQPNKLTDFDDANVEAFLRTKTDCSVDMKRNAIAIFKAFMNWAVSKNYIAKSPLKIKKPKRRRDQPHRFLTVPEIKKLKAAAEREHIFPQILTALYTGARKSEIARLRWTDLDFDKKQVMIRAGKSDHFRHVPMVTKYRKFMIGRKGKAQDLCFPGYQLDHWTNEMRIIRRIKKTCGFKDVTRFWYTLRHTFGSHYYMRTGDLKGLSEMMGHSDITITAGIYVHLLAKHKYKNIQKIDY